MSFPLVRLPGCGARWVRPAGRGLELLEGRRLLSAAVTQWHNNDASTGVNAAETQLTPGNITTSTFQKTFATTVDGQVYAQPLYEPGLSITVGGKSTTHDVTFVATQHDSLYAIDADGGTVLWQDSFLNKALAGAAVTGATAITSVPQADTQSTDISVEVGITSTPVIDTANQFLYVTAKTKQVVNGNTAAPHYVQKLFKVDTHTGSVLASVVIADTTYNGTTFTYNAGPYTVGTGVGATTVGGQSRVYFNGLRQLIRPALTLTGGKVVVASGSHGDNEPYHGWVLAYDASTLANTAAFNVTPNGEEAGIWQAGAAVSVDAQGYMYVVTGNGSFNKTSANFTADGFQKDGNYGDCILKLAFDTTTTVAKQSVNGYGIKVVDYFSPYNNSALNSVDRDLGSGGLTLLPDSAGSAAHPHLLVEAGKEGTIYLVDRDNMGKFSYSTDKVVQEQSNAVNGNLSTPAFFNGTLYWVGAYGDYAKTFTVANAVMSTKPTTQSADYYAFPGSSPSISANGTANAVVWTVDRATAQLRAYDASKGFAKEVWSTNLNPTRDALPSVTKFMVPTVANGRVYVGTLNSIVAYGPPAPAVTIPPAPTALAAAAASGIAINLAWTDSSNNESGFEVDQSSDGGKTFTKIATVGVNVTAYTVNNLTSGKAYAYRVAAYNERGTSAFSNTASATTAAIGAAVDFSAGFANAAATVSVNGSATVAASALQLTNNGTYQAGSAFTKSMVDVGKFTTAFTFKLTAPANVNPGDGFAFVLQTKGYGAYGYSGAGLGYQGLKPSVAVKFDLFSNGGEGSNSTGVYVHGNSPTTPSTNLAGGPIDLHSGHVFAVAIGYDGKTLTSTITDTTTGKSATNSYAVDIAAQLFGTKAYAGFTGGTGKYVSTQQILTWTFNPTPTSAPAAPTGLSAVAATGTSVNLTWADNANNEAGYKVYRSTDGKTYAVVANAAANATAFTDTQLLANTHYYYKVSATNAVGDSALSNAVDLTTPIPPPTPTNIKATTVAAGNVVLSWTNNATNATGYKVLREASTDTEFSQIGNLAANATGFVDTTAKAGVNYDYHVQCFNAAGYSDFVGINLTVPLTAPVLSAAKSTGKAVLTWTAATAAATFNLYRSTTKGGEGKTPYKTGLTGTTFTDTGLGSTTYYYKLTAVNKLAGESVTSNEA